MNSEKLARKLAEFQRRKRAKEGQAILEAMLPAQKGAVLKRFIGGDLHEKVNEFWIVFAQWSYRPFSTIDDTATTAQFKQWIKFCYESAGLPETVVLSISSIGAADLAEVEIQAIEEWVDFLRDYLTSNRMNFDILLATPSADTVLELWEEEHHYCAFLYKRESVMEN